MAWHPFLNNNCDGLWAGYYYCLWAGSSTPEPPVQTTLPEPVEPDTTSDCRAWFQGDGFTCDDIVYIFGRFSLSDFLKWNPRLAPSCENIRVCFPFSFSFFFLSLPSPALTPGGTPVLLAWAGKNECTDTQTAGRILVLRSRARHADNSDRHPAVGD